MGFLSRGSFPKIGLGPGLVLSRSVYRGDADLYEHTNRKTTEVVGWISHWSLNHALQLFDLLSRYLKDKQHHLRFPLRTVQLASFLHVLEDDESRMLMCCILLDQNLGFCVA